ncbi:MAG: hypothetical protein CL927_16625 [Deltaproteobacteria bacterium]|nr:hypothetical protein [Deltaproteobacteria bacterium]HCH65100.1 hypothetical protein [Deltaproteobacteria bacterium]
MRSPFHHRVVLSASWLWLMPGALGCRVDANDFKRSMVLEKPWKPDASAPSGDSEPETRLYQLLYTGEHGDTAHALGQKVRMTAWLRTVNLADAQLVSLTELGLTVQAEIEADRTARAALAEREAEVLRPIYTQIEAALNHPTTTNGDLDALAGELSRVRRTLYGDSEPQKEHRDRVRGLIKAVTAWLGTVNREQRMQLNSCRFVLNEHASPLTNPGSYASLVGMIWDRGDFSALQSGNEDNADGPLDLGGLWALEHLRAPPSGYMVDSARAGMLTLALMDPAFLPAAEASLTARGLAMPVLDAPDKPKATTP